ncbi:MAG TPA: helix-turn-helix domain-containing protein [Limnochordia bacterium]
MSERCQCPIERALQVIGAKWVPLIVRDLLEGPKRFNELQSSLGSVSPRTLSERLKDLEEQGVISRHAYPEVPPRVEYRLTPKGMALHDLLEDMRRWGERWA